MLAITTAFGEADVTATMGYYFSKTRTLSRRFRPFFSAYDTSLIKAHFITN